MRLIDADGSYTINASDNTGHSLCFGGGIISVMDDRGHCVCEFDAEDAPTVAAVVLPCKPGTTVYEVNNNTDACYDCRCYTGFCGDEYCDHPKHETEYPTIQDFPVCEKHFLEVISYAATEQQLFNNRKKFGKLIFLTSAAAEAALAKMKGCGLGG